MDRPKMLQLLLTLLAISLAAAGLIKAMRHNSMSLAENEKLNNTQSSSTEDSKDEGISSTDNSDGAGNDGADNHNDEETSATDNRDEATGSADCPGTENLQNAAEIITPVSLLTGSSLNGGSQLASRTAHAADFYYEPLSDAHRQYMTGISYPGTGTQSEAGDSEAAPQGGEPAPMFVFPFIHILYVHIPHHSFDGNPAEGRRIGKEDLWHEKRL